MTDKNSTSSGGGGEPRVVAFRRGPAAGRQPPPPVGGTDIETFNRNPESAADYRHRMMVNGAAFLIVLALIGAGYWLADTMARMRRDQDCVLSGRRNCAPIEVNKDRW